MWHRGTLLVSLLIAVSLVGGRAGVAAAQKLNIAAASDLESVFPAVVARFQQQTGRTVDVTFGSSGNFFSQLQNGAPFDVFFSADIDYPRQLEAARLTEPGTVYEYATGKIILWAAKSAPLDVARGLQLLLAPGVRHIAIANPEHAPYGRAAVAALRHEGLYENVRAKLVLGENISQAAQFVQSGNAEAGILALSLALAPALRDSGTYYVIPPSFYPPIRQAAVVLKSSRNKDLARQFLAFLKTPDIRGLMETSGFATQETPRTKNRGFHENQRS
jgi:molybdate transport system substrate-binding protein